MRQAIKTEWRLSPRTFKGNASRCRRLAGRKRRGVNLILSRSSESTRWKVLLLFARWFATDQSHEEASSRTSYSEIARSKCVNGPMLVFTTPMLAQVPIRRGLYSANRARTGIPRVASWLGIGDVGLCGSHASTSNRPLGHKMSRERPRRHEGEERGRKRDGGTSGRHVAARQSIRWRRPRRRTNEATPPPPWL